MRRAVNATLFRMLKILQDLALMNKFTVSAYAYPAPNHRAPFIVSIGRVFAHSSALKPTFQQSLKFIDPESPYSKMQQLDLAAS